MTRMCSIKKIDQQGFTEGFTLVELLVVISLIGILAGVMISILNPVKQRRVAEDGVKQSNLQKLALGIEAYANANSKYPTNAEMTPGGSNIPTSTEVAIFISKIPNGEPTAGTTYTYEGEAIIAPATPSYFGVSVPKSSDTTKCFKYHSSWGKIQDCSASAGCAANSIRNKDACN